MQEEGVLNCDSDSDVTHFSGTWSPYRINDFRDEKECKQAQSSKDDYEYDTPLAERKWTNANKIENIKPCHINSGIAPISIPQKPVENTTISSSHEVEGNYDTHLSVQKYTMSVNTLSHVVKLRTSVTPNTFLRKINEMNGNSQLSEEIRNETQREMDRLYTQDQSGFQINSEDCRLQIPKNISYSYGHGEQILKTFSIANCNSTFAKQQLPNYSEFQSPRNAKCKTPSLSPFRRRFHHQSPVARISPILPLKDNSLSPLLPLKTIEEKVTRGMDDQKVLKPPATATPTDSDAFRIIGKQSSPVIDSVGKKADHLRNSEDDSQRYHTGFEKFQKAMLKTNHVPLSKYFKIRKKLKKEKEIRKTLQQQLNGMNLSSGSLGEEFQSNSNAVAKLVTMSSLCPYSIHEVNVSVGPQGSETSSKIQQCNICPCICPKRQTMCHTNSEMNNLLSSMTPCLTSFLKDNLVTHVNDAQSDSSNHSMQDLINSESILFGRAGDNMRTPLIPSASEKVSDSTFAPSLYIPNPSVSHTTKTTFFNHTFIKDTPPFNQNSETFTDSEINRFSTYTQTAGYYC